MPVLAADVDVDPVLILVFLETLNIMDRDLLKINLFRHLFFNVCLIVRVVAH